VNRDRPFVTANFAITADGRISTRRHTPANFSSPRDKHRLHEIRATCDAVLAGVKTIATDNMTMGLPDEALRAAREKKGLPPYPLRVLLSASGRIDPGLKVFSRDFSPIVIFTTTRIPRAVQMSLLCSADLYLSHGTVNLVDMMQVLRRHLGVKRLVCEGGARVFRALLEAGLVDELHVTVCPRVFGGAKAPTLTGLAGDFLPQSTSLELQEMDVIDDECFLRYRVAHGSISRRRHR